ncbi:AfsA-related hotdog domain-containing protein [Amycolatopsis anabasis]|uniref:AfsA-related hotdog domain-containing protein n=1 Tax=Amycolatopsis anabasis TaxID=1840409 RepID=UPI00131DEF96|nr:AfsA-related hotdog domain-containing protein [Amycolatopsis anabasis]
MITAVIPDLAYDQTVPRDLLHRWSLSEVFLTGYARVDEERFACAAQLPLSHGYFRDHVAAAAWHDPLNVLEAGRQAMTYAAHVHQGAPRATAFMVRSWRLEITDRAALACGERPGELRVEGAVPQRRVRGGHLRRLLFELDLVLDGRALGHLSMDIGCTPAEQYLVLRRMQRGAEIATAFALPAGPAGTPVHPSAVDKHDPRNVVLDGARIEEGALGAVLSPRTFRNRSMYDHPYDHVPAMVLSEAARQCAFLLSGKDPGGRVVLRLDGRFDRFAEVDAPVELTTTTLPEPGSFRMAAAQGGAVVASIDLALG